MNLNMEETDIELKKLVPSEELDSSREGQSGGAEGGSDQIEPAKEAEEAEEDASGGQEAVHFIQNVCHICEESTSEELIDSPCRCPKRSLHYRCVRRCIDVDRKTICPVCGHEWIGLEPSANNKGFCDYLTEQNKRGDFYSSLNCCLFVSLLLSVLMSTAIHYWHIQLLFIFTIFSGVSLICFCFYYYKMFEDYSKWKAGVE